MDYKHFSQNSYVDILFSNRNKTYGSYQYRIHYNSNAYKSIATFIASLLIIIALAKWLAKENIRVQQNNEDATLPKDVLLTQVIIDKEKIKNIEIPTSSSKQSAGVKTIRQSAKTAIVPNNIEVDPRDLIKDIPEDAQAGLHDHNTNNQHGNAGSVGDGQIDLDNDIEKHHNDMLVNNDDQVIHQLVDIKAVATYDVIAFIKKHLAYPELARANGIEGTLFIHFVVEKDGAISHVALANKDIGGGCSQAAIDVVKKFPKWKPAMKNNVAVRSFMKVPINFKLLK